MVVESYSALDAVPGIRAGFIRRIPEVDVAVEREEALARLQSHHEEIRHAAGFGTMVFATAEQVHGDRVVEVSSKSLFPIAGADGLLTMTPGICLGIYVADCAAVFIADRHARGIALVHSGKKGTELGISKLAAQALCQATGAVPADLIAQVSPCIRPPHYEIDFASEIVRQLQNHGVGEVHDCSVCTACHPDLYYSYRQEKGRTGRMLAMMVLLPGKSRAQGA